MADDLCHFGHNLAQTRTVLSFSLQDRDAAITLCAAAIGSGNRFAIPGNRPSDRREALCGHI